MEILKRIKYCFFLLIISLSFLGCNSTNAPDCFQSAGEETTISITELESFNQLVIYDDIELEIIEAENEYFELTYGENLIPEIIYEYENDSISFFNYNSCGWTRDFKKPKLKWFTDKESINIISLSNGNIITNDTLYRPISIRTENAVGDINLLINNSYILLSSNSSANYNVIGRSDELTIYAYFNDGIYECENLQVNNAKILHRGYNDIIVNAKNSITGSIENAGRILYVGNPSLNVEVSNGGELIQIE
ncbi:DUF2807 domain-containing protein [Marivirga arenosa]|uniref:DUF2807 domain-containing protein n=1 Tax=Marivirga arenosa TaxID=3059076 RepID=A0AA51N9G2_9BACT|nr:DUF2807 domain-containing protein [Marivirga sp. ABR2-2]WMN06961.1 DUF2807 domain-containing protein [Marivirga sp. ABR2-2]